MISFPMYIHLPEKCIKIVAGSFHSYAITQKGVWVWGKNDNCNIHPDITEDIIRQPQFLNLKVQNISTCTSHSFGWKDKKVFCWGSNLNYELGMQDERQYGITQMKVYQQAIETGLSIVGFSCGETHSLAVFRQNQKQTKLFAWGQSKSNQLTLDTTSVVPYPVLSQFSLNIHQIYSRSDYNIAVCENGLYSWGKNVFGRLGFPKINNAERIPTLIQLKKKIIKIGIGVYHSIGVCQDGEAYGWGHAFEGQLGIGKIPGIECTATKVLCEQLIIDAGCGELHSIVLLKNGKIMSCGSNKYQALGHKQVDEMKKSLKLQYVEGLEDVMSISCGNRHNLVLTKAGKVLGWGSNKFGQVGQNDKNYKPALINESEQKKQQNIEQMIPLKRVEIKQDDNNQGQGLQKNKNQHLVNKIQAWKDKYNSFILKKQQQQKNLLEELSQILKSDVKNLSKII